MNVHTNWEQYWEIWSWSLFTVNFLFHFALLCFLNYTDMARVWTCIAWIRPWITNCLNWEDMPDPRFQILFSLCFYPKKRLCFLPVNSPTQFSNDCSCIFWQGIWKITYREHVCACVMGFLYLKWLFYLWASRIEGCLPFQLCLFASSWDSSVNRASRPVSNKVFVCLFFHSANAGSKQ